MGRPEMTRYGLAAMLVVAASVIAGALTWGVLWSGLVVLLHRQVGAGRGGRWWNVAVKALTAALMLYFAVGSAARLAAG